MYYKMSSKLVKLLCMLAVTCMIAVSTVSCSNEEVSSLKDDLQVDVHYDYAQNLADDTDGDEDDDLADDADNAGEDGDLADDADDTDEEGDLSDDAYKVYENGAYENEGNDAYLSETKTYVAINDNVPYFTDKEKKNRENFEKYSELDSLGRCGVAYANICPESMPVEERGSIGHVKPSGWQFAKYDIVDGKYLYNRCHLIGYQLAGENANELNLITGTRYMNVQGMLPFENQVADYVEETGNHVLYRVTPEYTGDNLLADGVGIEAWSVEDDGEGICFNVFVYNIQPGIKINYATGESSMDGAYENDNATEQNDNKDVEGSYIINTNTDKFHYPSCSSVSDMKEKNKQPYTGSRQKLIDNGYVPCGNCHP